PQVRPWVEALERRDLPATGMGYYPPVAINDYYSVGHNHTLSVAASGILANDQSYNGHALTDVLVGGVGHGSLTLNSNGSFTYTPTAGFVGSDSFTYKAYDGSQYSNIATVGISVTNTAPVVTNPGSLTDNEGASVSRSITASDADGDPLTYSATNLPTGLIINASTGLISGTLGSQSAGSYSATVSVSDGYATTTTTFGYTIVDVTVP